MVSLAGGVPPQAPTLLAGADPAPAGNLLQMRIYLELRDKAAARQMNEDLHNSASSNYHKWLNPQKFDEMFGPLQTTYDEISAWLQSQGFSVTAVRRDRRDIEFSGTVAQADQAFHVQILGMRDGKHYGITSDPMIPTRFQVLSLASWALTI
jgi:subtilase family serine protease